MSDKALQKKNLIIEKAYDVFAKKGYRQVTMKDIVEACKISRGGLYLYFSSTEEVFLEVLKWEEEHGNELETQEALTYDSIGELLLLFFKEQKKKILRKKSSLAMAKYEYAFVCREQKKTLPFRKQYETERLVLEKLLERGVRKGEFYCEDPHLEAGNMMLAIEGMKICSCTIGIGEKRIDQEFYQMTKRILAEE